MIQKLTHLAAGLAVSSVVILSVLAACSYCYQLKADIHVNGIEGRAEVTYDQATATASVKLNVSQDLNATEVGLRSLWVDYDVEDICSESQLGDSLAGGAQPVILKQNNIMTLQFQVPSLEAIEGASIKLKTEQQKTACATLEKDGEYRTAVAQFQDKVFGTVYFRQHMSAGSWTHIVSDLFTSENVNTGVWKITDSYSSCLDVDPTLDANVYNPGSTANLGCGINNPQNCAIGDLSTKLGYVPLGQSTGQKRKAYVDKNLPLNGTSYIGSKLLLIYHPNSNGIIACAQISLFFERSALAQFSHDGVSGSVTFAQVSPLDPTVTTVELDNLRQNADGYHVHLWPTPVPFMEGQQLCSAAAVSGHFNPYNKDVNAPTYPAPRAGTVDQYEVGDLSAKYGTLQGLNKTSIRKEDRNLPLFGRNSIIGRSLVIHRSDATKSRWVCANVEPIYPVVAAVAVFKYPVIGRVMFLQTQNMPHSETSVFVSLDYNDGRAKTQGHKWAVYTNKAQGDMLDVSEALRCKSTGSMMYSPQGSWQGPTSQSYDQYCNTHKPLACKMGDLSQTLGLLNIRTDTAGDTSAKHFFTSTSLPLSGVQSIVGKSVVIMNSDGTGILSCANIEMLHVPTLSARLSMGGISGSVEFKQMAGFGAQRTSVTNNLSGLGDNHRLRIHELPPTTGSNPCYALGSVYNPLNVQDTAVSGTDDKYKVGDLTRFMTQKQWKDTNLPLTGLTSIMGRSLAVVDSTDQDRVVACAKINIDLPDDSAQQVTAVSSFTGAVSGTFNLYQTLYGDGTMSDTSIEVTLHNQDGTQTPNHNWHTHESPVQKDIDATSGTCMSAGPHFDPYRAMNNSDNYKVECQPGNPLRCEVGDQAAKLGTYNIGGGRKVFTDVDLPLSGKYTVQGKSIVVHVQDRGAGRLACADLVPVTTDFVIVEFKTLESLNKSDVRETYAKAVGANVEDLVVEFVSKFEGLTKVHVHFIGLQRKEMRSKFLKLLGNKNSNFGPYIPVFNDAGVNVPSAAVLLTLVVAAVAALHL